MKPQRIAVIGGGPIGVEAALYGACAGFDVHLYEQGRIAENVRQWEYIGLFTEWGRNRSPLACRFLQERGETLPPAELTSRGGELADYVVRLTSLAPLQGRVHPQTQVVAVTRERVLKSDFLDDPRRGQAPFRLLLRGAFGEKTVHADAVIDATGVYATPNYAGNGGAPCAGELACARLIDYHLPDVSGRDRSRFANRHTLIVGSGHSAASTLRSICDLLEEAPQTRVTWVVRRDVPAHGFPYTLDPNDSSPHRDALHRRANELSRHPAVEFHPRTVIDKIAHDGKSFQVQLNIAAPKDGTGEYSVRQETIPCDNIAAHTGFRPDFALWRELQVDIHHATEGVLRQAQNVVRENRRLGIGLSTGYAEKRPQNAERESQAAEHTSTQSTSLQPVANNPVTDNPVANDPELLRHCEPNFFVVGIKSYGRDAGFLMQNGFRQVRDVYKLLSGEPTLDLYNGEL
ncbi:MAG TPA: FAD-dependent oxidoreductase [Abditibacteriaceae bacterium]|jgi:thioredoxin reductase